MLVCCSLIALISKVNFLMFKLYSYTICSKHSLITVQLSLRPSICAFVHRLAQENHCLALNALLLLKSHIPSGMALSSGGFQSRLR